LQEEEKETTQSPFGNTIKKEITQGVILIKEHRMIKATESTPAGSQFVFYL